MEKKYDLEERTKKFGENVISFCKKIPRDEITRPLITQLVKSGTSIGANYYEANCAESRKDFEHKIGICKKEAKETLFWLQMFEKTLPSHKELMYPLLKEGTELYLIFVAIVKKTKENDTKEG